MGKEKREERKRERRNERESEGNAGTYSREGHRGMILGLPVHDSITKGKTKERVRATEKRIAVRQ